MSQPTALTVSINVLAVKAAELQKLSALSESSLKILASKVEHYQTKGKLPELEKKLKSFQGLI